MTRHLAGMMNTPWNVYLEDQYISATSTQTYLNQTKRHLQTTKSRRVIFRLHTFLREQDSEGFSFTATSNEQRFEHDYNEDAQEKHVSNKDETKQDG